MRTRQDEKLTNFAVWKLAWRSLWGPHGQRPPRTPIRWLCLRAFCYLAATSGRSLSQGQLDGLTQTIELGVFLNRCFDGKSAFSPSTYRRLRRGLPSEPLRMYLRQLRDCEKGRPGGGEWARVQFYRREVLRISLQVLFRLAEIPPRDVLLPLVCQIQLTDDILDRGIDRALGLPTLIHPEAPPASQQARDLWTELKSYQRPADAPVVALGFLVYLLSRLAALSCRIAGKP